MVALLAGPASAQREPPPETADTAALPWRYEAWLGLDGTQRYTSLWAGVTWSPSGAIEAPGWRLRSVSGGGRYAYDGWRLVKGVPTRARFDGTSAFADAMIGYQWQLGRLTLKPFAGIAIGEHWTEPKDPLSRLNGRTIGAKLALETWWNITDTTWLNVDGSWSQVHDTTTVKARLGYRLVGDVSLGFEASLLKDVSQEMQRVGWFVRYAWQRGEVSLGGGLSGRSWEEAARKTEPYVGLTVLGRF